MAASARSGMMNVATGAAPSATGPTPAIAKQTCAPAHSDRAGAAVLNATRTHGSRRRHEMRKLSTATAKVAGPGPNSTAVVMKNVSATEMLADTDAKFSLKEPATIASAEHISQPA